MTVYQIVYSADLFAPVSTYCPHIYDVSKTDGGKREGLMKYSNYTDDPRLWNTGPCLCYMGPSPPNIGGTEQRSSRGLDDLGRYGPRNDVCNYHF